MIWQYIIIGIILISTFVFIIINIIKFFTNPFDRCKNCSNFCDSCPINEIKKQLEEREKL